MELLTAVESRVLGTLIEKSMATPEYYPLTLKSLQAGCNQATSRLPVSEYSETEIDDALKSLKLQGLVHYVEPQRGGTAWRYGHTLLEEHRWKLNRGQIALLAVLMLRGDQTTGELRQRVSSLYIFPGAMQVEESLQAMVGMEEPMVIALPKAAGQREFRWRFTRVEGAGEIPPEALRPADFFPNQTMGTDPGSSSMRVSVSRTEFDALAGRVQELEDRLRKLEESSSATSEA